jgi:hypothetical protein
MAKHENDFGIIRGIEYQKVTIQELIGVKNIKTVRESMELVNLSTAKRSYTGDELIDSGFIEVRKLFDQGWTRKQILEDYLGIQSTSGSSTSSKRKEDSDDLAAIESALKQGALEVGEVFAESAAAYLVEQFPELLIQNVRKRVGSGELRAAFAKARQETQARQLSSAVEANRHQEMLNNFDFSGTGIQPSLRSAAPSEDATDNIVGD